MIELSKRLGAFDFPQKSALSSSWVYTSFIQPFIVDVRCCFFIHFSNFYVMNLPAELFRLSNGAVGDGDDAYSCIW